MQAEIAVHASDFEVKGRLERTGSEMYSFTVAEPESLVGLCVRVEQENCLLSYQGMELPLQTETLPSGFALKMLDHALDQMMRQDGVTLQNTADGGGILTGKVDENSFEFRLNGRCCPVSFSVPKLDLVITWAVRSE